MDNLQSIRDRLAAVLKVANYGKADAYVEEFIEMTVKEALMDCIQGMDEEQSTKLEEAAKEAGSADELLEKLVQNVDQELLKQKLADRAGIAFKKLLDAIVPKLDPTQGKQLVEALQK